MSKALLLMSLLEGEEDVTKDPADVKPVPLDGNAPNKTLKAYKLFRTMKNKPGKIFPLFIGKNIPVPVGKWVEAEFLPTKGFAQRPGWHVGRKPIASHLMRKDGTMPEDRVWAEIEIPADVDWQPKADQSKTKDIPGEVPKGGYYKFKRPFNQGGEWLIAGAMKVNRILSNEEVAKINGVKESWTSKLVSKAKQLLEILDWDDPIWVKSRNMKSKGYNYAIKHKKTGEVKYFKNYKDIDNFNKEYDLEVL